MTAILLSAVLVYAAGAAKSAHALDDGLARTPPMGWNDWNAFQCNVSEALVQQTADFFVSSGMRDAGYEFVNIDDCWALPQRDSNGNLVPNPAKFPNGIQAVADYVHERGLKFGIYATAGTHTCNRADGFPGSLGHEAQDAALFASWGVDYLKYDNCNNQGIPAVERYTAMRDALAATGRPIVYSICNWGQGNPWEWGPTTGNLWRTTGDTSDSYASMVNRLSRAMWKGRRHILVNTHYGAGLSKSSQLIGCDRDGREKPLDTNALGEQEALRNWRAATQ